MHEHTIEWIGTEGQSQMPKASSYTPRHLKVIN
jgi:hypothetical protein